MYPQNVLKVIRVTCCDISHLLNTHFIVHDNLAICVTGHICTTHVDEQNKKQRKLYFVNSNLNNDAYGHFVLYSDILFFILKMKD